MDTCEVRGEHERGVKPLSVRAARCLPYGHGGRSTLRRAGGERAVVCTVRTAAGRQKLLRPRQVQRACARDQQHQPAQQ